MLTKLLLLIKNLKCEGNFYRKENGNDDREPEMTAGGTRVTHGIDHTMHGLGFAHTK